MSADNAVWIAKWPTDDGGHEYRVSQYMSASQAEEIGTHFLSGIDEEQLLERAFGDCQVFDNRIEATARARALMESEDYVEYGICDIVFDRPFGVVRENIKEPELSEGACKHCSTPGVHEVHHGVYESPENWNYTGRCRNPELPYNILAIEIGKRFDAVNQFVITRNVIEILNDAGLMIVSKDEK